MSDPPVVPTRESDVSHLPAVINVFPISSAPPSSLQIAIAKLAERPVPPVKKCDSALELALLVADDFSDNALPNAFREALTASEVYRDWKRRMPRLKDVPDLRTYRNRLSKHDPVAVSNSIARYGLVLPAQQMLFHGGNWPLGCPAPGQTFKTPTVLSTSLCPQVAAVHALPEPRGEIWTLEVASSSSVRAFVFNDHGKQRLAHEREVLLGSGVTLTCLRVHTKRQFRVIELRLS